MACCSFYQYHDHSKVYVDGTVVFMCVHGSLWVRLKHYSSLAKRLNPVLKRSLYTKARMLLPSPEDDYFVR